MRTKNAAQYSFLPWISAYTEILSSHTFYLLLRKESYNYLLGNGFIILKTKEEFQKDYTSLSHCLKEKEKEIRMLLCGTEN